MTSFGRLDTISVLVTPGATAFTRIWYFPNSLANDFVFTRKILENLKFCLQFDTKEGIVAMVV